tara:strand:- start:3794 stop:4408 length:615 start_codon:yes stop_codon:yes gene_type:complete
MFEFLTQQFRDFFDIKGAISTFLQRYYEIRESEGVIDGSWETFRKQSRDMNIPVAERVEDLVKLYSEDVARSYSTLTAGNLVVFEYTSLKLVKKAYFALIVGTKYGNGVYGNVNTKNDLMSCFLIDSGTDLNTLASVVNVLHSAEAKRRERKYQSLSNPKANRDLRNDAGVSKEGMTALFPTTEFRTFRLNTGMQSIYKLNLDG